MSNRLHWRMLIIALVPVTLVSVGLSLTILTIGFSDLQDALDRHSTSQLRQLASSAEFPLVSGDKAALATMARKLVESDPDVQAVAILDNKDKALVQIGQLPPKAAQMDANEGQITRLGDASVLVRIIKPSRLPLENYYQGTESTPLAQSLGKVVLVISQHRLIGQRGAQLRLAGFFTLIGAAFGALLAFGLAKGIRQVLTDATEVVTQIGRGKLDARMKISSTSVLNELEHGINQMAQRVAWSHQDLSEAIKTATAQISAERDLANRATQAKTHFLASASHDLRQPIHALSLFTEHALSLDSPAEQNAVLQKISLSVVQLRALLDSLLDLSRLETGEAVPQLETFRLDQRVGQVCDGLAHLALSKGLDLRYRLQPITIESDPHLLDRILLNLIGNAIRYTDHGGVLVSCRRREGSVRLAVWDTGIGIAEESLSEIFDDYVQLANRERSQDKGLGLGLSICRLAARLLGSEVHVRSRPGRGSVFWLDLPLTSSLRVNSLIDAPDRAVDASAIPAFASEAKQAMFACCLVLDPDPVRGQATGDLLHSLFSRIALASSEAACLALIAEADPEVVVCECNPENLERRRNFLRQLGYQTPALRLVVLADNLDRAQRTVFSDDGLIVLQMPLQPARLRAALQANHLDFGS